jgi:hypothetical protein
MLAVEITTIAELGTAAGTLVLALATFASVRSARRTAEIAERSLRVGLRPVLVQTRPEDPGEPVLFPEGVKMDISHGQADVQIKDDSIFMAIPVRNVGAGMAVLHGWHVNAGWLRGTNDDHPEPEDFRAQLRDIYVPPSDSGYWQAAIRDPEDRFHAEVRSALEMEPAGITVFLMYGDHEGGQRTITRFGLRRLDDGSWLPAVSRHWNLEAGDARPRPDFDLPPGLRT